MKKAVVLLIILLMTFCIASADSVAYNPLEDESIKIHIAETFSDRQDGAIVWDDASAGFWTGSNFFEWPEAQWKNGQLVMTDFPGLVNSRMTFRIQTKEMQLADISGSVGIGFYVENNTQSEQSIGFYMVGSSSCLKNKNDTTLLFIDIFGNITKSVVTDNTMAMIPPGAKGYVLGYYEDFQNLWSSDAYNPNRDRIVMPGFEITGMLIDGDNEESIVIDNVFYFGADCLDNNDRELISRTFEEQPTEEPTEEATQEPQISASLEATEQVTDDAAGYQDDSTVIYILSCAIVLVSIVAAVFIAKKK